MLNLYPLKLEPQLKEVVWGGRWLATALSRPASAEARLGESWEAYGGSTVANGEWQGRKLGDLFTEYGANLLGAAAAAYPKFPLLVKFIDAKQNLSVQIHPDNALAAQLEGQTFGKTEFWYIIQAESDAAIYYGLNDEAQDHEQLQEAIKAGNLTRYLQKSPVRAGDVVFIPAGTVHALTGGIVVYELQQDSDITYRLYDWGRTDRPIHIEKGLQAVKLAHRNMEVTHPTAQPVDGYDRTPLLTNQYFAADLLTIRQPTRLTANQDSFALLSILNGNGNLTATDAAFEPLALTKGDTVLVPATLPYVLTPTSEPLEVIVGSVAK